MNYFPNGDEEIDLIKFIAKFQYLNVSDTKYFFSSKKYYRNRVSNLISKRFLKKLKSNLVLDELGIEYAKLFNFEYNTLNRNKKYSTRLMLISRLAAFYHNCTTVKFTPSFAIKDKEMFTITARRFIGIFEINGFDYLTYYISKEHDNKYIMSVVYDIQKEKKYKNIMIFVSDINRINLSDFAFGLNEVLIIEDNKKNREDLKYLHSINWFKIVNEKFRNKLIFSEYNFCDYTDNKNKYVSRFYFLDTEKINRIKYFLRENKNKNAYIVCSPELEIEIKKELPSANYLPLDLEEYIDKERFVYD